MNVTKVNVLKTNLVGRFQQLYVFAAMLIVTFYVNPSISFAASTELAECTSTQFNVPTFLLNAKGLVEDPVKWIQWAAVAVLPLFLVMAFFKLKSSKGRQEKIEDGMKMIYWLIGGDVAIFGVMWFSGWILAKLC